MTEPIPVGDDGFLDMDAFDDVAPDDLEPVVRQVVAAALLHRVEPLDDERWREVLDRSTAFDLELTDDVDGLLPLDPDAPRPEVLDTPDEPRPAADHDDQHDDRDADDDDPDDDLDPDDLDRDGHRDADDDPDDDTDDLDDDLDEDGW